jgi:hypothetical protein
MIHTIGRDYRHNFEATFFGMPLLRVNEGYVDGKSFFESPMGTYYNNPNTNQGANLALWAEGGWFPSTWVIDPQVPYETVDDNTALLFIPFQDQTENFVVRFDPQARLADTVEAIHFKAPNGENKILWITSSSRDGSVSYATWLDAGKPWAALSLEQLVFHADVVNTFAIAVSRELVKKRTAAKMG